MKKQEKKSGRHAGLGRGLGALLDAPTAPVKPIQRPVIPALGKKIAKPEPEPEVVAAEPAPRAEVGAGSVLTVPVTEVVRSPWQPRQTFDETELQELADSIKANGIIQPLICRKQAEGHFELIGG